MIKNMDKNMKKIMILAGVVLTMMSCQEEIKTTRGLVKRMSDTTMVAQIDKYDIVFDTKKAKYDNGAVMVGDSVTIRYIGDLREKKARALLLCLIPKKGTVVEAVYDPSKELIVSDKPMTEQQVNDEKKFAKSGRD